MIRPHPGWYGAFTRDQAAGAWANGTRIVKINVEDGDAHPIGCAGTVLGSVAATDEQRASMATEFGRRSRFLYFVEWDGALRRAVAVVEAKIGLERDGASS